MYAHIPGQEQNRLDEVRAQQMAWAQNLKGKNDTLANVKLPKGQKEAPQIK